MSVAAPELAIPGELFTASELAQAQGILRRAHGMTDKETRVAIGGVFMIYRQVMQRKLAEELKATEALTSGQVTKKAQDLLKYFMPGWRAMMIPILAQAYTNGARQTGYAVDPAYINRLATRYATQLGTKLNDVSAEALGRGFQAQLNRNIAKRVALENVVSSFGVSRKTTNMLVNLWTVKEDIKAHDRDVGSLKKQRVKRLVNAALRDRALAIGENESWTAREQGKQIAWMYARRQGLVNTNSRRRWVTAKDERVCPYCGPMNASEVAVEEQFKVPGVGKIWSPPLHPQCRCHIELDQGGAKEIPISSWGRVKRFINLFKDPDNTVRKSDNDWETQPRAKTGRFGSRPQRDYAEAELDLQAMVDDQARAEQLKEINRALQKQPGFISRLRAERDAGIGFGGAESKGFGGEERERGFGEQQHGFGRPQGFGAATGFGGQAQGFGGEELGPRPTDIKGETVPDEKPKRTDKAAVHLDEPLYAFADQGAVVRDGDNYELTGGVEFRSIDLIKGQIRGHAHAMDRRFLKQLLQGEDYLAVDLESADQYLTFTKEELLWIMDSARKGNTNATMEVMVLGKVDEHGNPVSRDDLVWGSDAERDAQLEAYEALEDDTVDSQYMAVDDLVDLLDMNDHIEESKPSLVVVDSVFTDPEMSDVQPDARGDVTGVIRGGYRSSLGENTVRIDGVEYLVHRIEPKTS